MNLTLELSKDEEITLTGCEQIIERGLKTFVEVGEALITIRDGRLYRASHGTFESYCSERWNLSRKRAYDFMDASEVVSAMSPMGDILPDSERQVRPLTPLKDTPALAVAAWEDAQVLAQEEGLPAPVARHVEAAAAPYREAVKVAEAEKVAADKPLSIFEGGGGSRHFSYDNVPTPTTPTEIIESVRSQKVAHVSHNSGENEWYTPSEYIEAARQVLGVIELDPASSGIANQTVKAERFITKEQDALSQPWQARTVWMNPPYSGDLVKGFAAKFAEHILAGDVSEGIVLVNNATETRWFAELVTACGAVVFPTGRIRYLDATGTPANSPLQGQAFLYAGDNPDAFIKVFSQFGWGAILTGGAS